MAVTVTKTTWMTHVVTASRAEGHAGDQYLAFSAHLLHPRPPTPPNMSSDYEFSDDDEYYDEDDDAMDQDDDDGRSRASKPLTQWLTLLRVHAIRGRHGCRGFHRVQEQAEAV